VRFSFWCLAALLRCRWLRLFKVRQIQSDMHGFIQVWVGLLVILRQILQLLQRLFTSALQAVINALQPGSVIIVVLFLALGKVE
jgi:hypothetical protein